MVIIPMYKTCPKCHKKYSWNPDVGKFICPYCGGIGRTGKLLEAILTKRKKEK